MERKYSRVVVDYTINGSEYLKSFGIESAKDIENKNVLIVEDIQERLIFIAKRLSDGKIIRGVFYTEYEEAHFTWLEFTEQEVSFIKND